MDHNLHIPSVPNLRDLGGYATQDGRCTRCGLLYRSDQLINISEVDLQAIAALGLRKVYDLRTSGERTPHPDQVPGGVQDVVLDVLADAKQAAPAELLSLFSNPQEANARLGGGKIAVLFTQGYREFVSLPSALVAYRRLFTELVDQRNLPALFHCTTGKDRTGWAAAALLTLCGVSDSDVYGDYLLSNDYILPKYQAQIDQLVASGVEQDILLAVLGVRREYLEAAFAELHDKFGSIEDYFTAGLGIDVIGQEALRTMFLE